MSRDLRLARQLQTIATAILLLQPVRSGLLGTWLLTGKLLRVDYAQGSLTQVVLVPTALATEGAHAATVSVPGGNKSRLRDGVATFKDVKILAEHSGCYKLTAKAAGRKFTVGILPVLCEASLCMLWRAGRGAL